MLEGLVSDVLTRVLGHYVDGLSKESIRVGIWGGELALRNLALRPEAVAVLFETLGLDLPVTVTAGFVGLLRVEVPWNRLRSAPVKVLIEGVTVAASPVSDGDQKALAERALRLKRARLARDEVVRDAKWSVRQEDSGRQRRAGGVVKWGWQFTSKFVTKIVDNLQFEVKDVVVRYEDESSVIGRPYTVSLALDSLRAFSTDAEWNRVFLEDISSPLVHKLVQLEGLVVNWDPGSGAKALRSWILGGNLGRPEGESAASVRADGRHVIAPMSGEMRVALTKAWALETSSDQSTGGPSKRPRPRVQMDICFPEIDLSVDEFQYHSLLTTIAYLSDIDRKARPKSPRARWFWALDRLLPRFTERRDAALSFTEEGLCRRRRERLRYIESRKKVLNARRKGLREPTDLARALEDLEAKLDIRDIQLFRDQVDSELGQEVDAGNSKATARSSVWSLFTRAKGRETNIDDQDDIDDTKMIMSRESSAEGAIPAVCGRDDQEANDLDAVENGSGDSGSDADFLDLPENFESSRDSYGSDSTEAESSSPNFRMGFLLERGSIQLNSGGFESDPEKAANLVFRDLLLGIETSPCHGFLLEMLLGTIELLDLRSGVAIIYPRSPWVGRHTLEQRSYCESSKSETGLSFYPNEINEALTEIRGGYEQPDVTFSKTDDSSVERSSTSEQGSLSLSEESQYIFNPDDSWEKPVYPLQYVAALRIKQESAPAESIWAAGASRVAMDLAIGGLEAVVDGPSGCFVASIRFWIPKMSEASVMAFLSRAAAPRLAHLRMELQKALLERSVPMRLNILIQSPRFIMPSSSGSKISLVFDLGTFAMSTVETASEATYESIVISPSIGGSAERPVHYTDYRVTFSDLGIFLTLGEEDNSAERLVKPFSLHLLTKALHNASYVEATCRPEARPHLARRRMRGQLSALKVCISRRTFRHLLKITKSWNCLFQDDETQTEALDRISHFDGEQVGQGQSQCQQSLANDAQIGKRHSALALFQMELEFPDLKLELRNQRNKRIVTLDSRGTSVKLTKRDVSFEFGFELQAFTIIDGSRGSTAPFRELVHTGNRQKIVSEEGTIGVEERKPSFVNFNYSADLRNKEQHLEIRILSMHIQCVRESYLAIAEFFYRVDGANGADDDSRPTEMYSDPFEALGMTTVTAALRLKERAERGIVRSKQALADRGQLVVTAVLDGMDALLITDEGGIASFAVTRCTAKLEQSKNGAIRASGRLGGFCVRDLTASCGSHSEAVTYLCDENRESAEKDGWSVIIPPTGEGDYWLRARLRNLRIVYLQRFLVILRTYFDVLRSMLQPILSMKGSILEVFEGELGECMAAIAPKRDRLRLNIVTDDVNFIMPRHSQSPHEGLHFVVGRSIISNEDQAAPGYRVGVQLNVEDVTGYVIFCNSHDEESGGGGDLTWTSNKNPASLTPFVERVRLIAKIDWWRRRKVPQIVINDEGAPVLKKGENEVDYDPKRWLAAFRLRITASDGLNARMCEAEYTILYFTFTENIIERPDIEFTDLVSGLKTPVIPYRSPIEPIMLSSHPMPPFISIIFEVPYIHSVTAYGSDPGSPSTNLVETELLDVYGKFQYGVDCRIVADISGNLGYMRDIRPQSSSRQIVVSPMKAVGITTDSPKSAAYSLRSQSRQITYTYDRPFGFRSNIMLVLCDLRVMVIPELFRDLGLLTPIGFPFLKSSAPAPVIRFNGRLLIVTLSGTEVWVMADQFPGDGRSIILRGDVIAKVEWTPVTGRKVLNVATKGVRLGLSSYGQWQAASPSVETIPREDPKRGIETPFVYPFDASVNFQTAGWDPPNGSGESPVRVPGKSLNVILESILCRTDVNDMPLLVAVLSRFTRIKASSLSSRVQPISRLARYKDETNEFDSKFSIICSLLNGRLIFTDEAGGKYTPIMEIRSQHFTLNSSFPWMTSGGLEICVDLFNEKRGCWEPGVEPFRVEVLASLGRSGSRAIQLRSEENINVNVSPAIVSSAARVWMVMKSAIEDLLHCVKCKSAKDLSTDEVTASLKNNDLPVTHRPSVAAFCVRNDSGRPVTVWFPHDSARKVIDGEGGEFEVDMPTDELAISTGVGKRDSEDANTLRSEVLRCMVSFSGYQPLSLSVAEVGSHVVRFLPRGPFDAEVVCNPLCMVWDVGMREGVPIGCLRSSVRIINETSTVLEVRLRSPMVVRSSRAALDPELVVLKAGDSWPIPLDAVNEEIRIRPAIFHAPDLDEDESNLSTQARRVLYTYGWSDPLSKISTLIKEGERLEAYASAGLATKAVKRSNRAASLNAPIVTCPAAVHGRPFIVTLFPRTHKSVSPEKFYASSSWIDVVFHSPIVVENATPFPVKFFLAHASKAMQEDEHVLVVSSSVRNSRAAQVNTAGIDMSKLALGIMAESYRSAMHPNAACLESIPLGPQHAPLNAMLDHQVSILSHKVTIYFDFWIRNRSDSDLYFSCSSRYGDPLHAKLLLKGCPPGKPADPYHCFSGPYVSFQIVGSETESWLLVGAKLGDIQKPVALNFRTRSLLMNVRRGKGRFHRTLIVTVWNAVWLENRTGLHLQWCQPAAPSIQGASMQSKIHTLRDQEISSVHWNYKDSEYAICFRRGCTDGKSEWMWTRPLLLGEQTGDYAVKMYCPRKREQYIARANVDKLVGGSFVVTLHKEDRSSPPYRIVNSCKTRSIAFHQSNVSETHPWLLRPGKSTRYSWDEPNAPGKTRYLAIEVIDHSPEYAIRNRKMLNEENDGEALTADASGIRASRSNKFLLSIDAVTGASSKPIDGFTSFPLFVSVVVVGPTKVVTFEDEARPNPMQKKTMVTSDESEIPRQGLKSDAPARASGRNENLDLEFWFESMGISFVDASPCEIAYLRVSHVECRMDRFEDSELVLLQVGDLQLDNQLSRPTWPTVIWAPASPEASSLVNVSPGARREKPVLEIIVDRPFPTLDHGILICRGLFCSLQHLDIHLDEEFIVRAYAFARSTIEALGAESDDARHEPLGEADGFEQGFDTVLRRHGPAKDSDSANQSRLYVEQLELCPSKMTMSFRSSRSSSFDAGVLGPYLRTLMAVLGNVDSAELRFHALQLSHLFDTWSHFLSLVSRFYLSQLSGQKLAFIASNPLIGNPSALFESIASGASDFFIEPYKARTSTDFILSLGRGSSSLITNTFSGVLGSLSGIPRALSSGLEHAVGDESYLRQRDKILHSRIQGKHNNPAHGLFAGAVSFGHGIASGAAGLVREPITGAVESGATGFLKGIGKGVIGGVVKPITGALDLISEPAEGFRVFVKGAGLRPNSLRPRRSFLGGRLTQYDLRSSLGNFVLDLTESSVGENDSISGTGRPQEPEGVRHWTVLSKLEEALGQREVDVPEAAVLWALLTRFGETGGEHVSASKVRLGLITTSRVIVCSLVGDVVFEADLERVAGTRAPLDDRGWLMVGVIPATSDIRVIRPPQWHRIRCESLRGRDEFERALNSARRSAFGDDSALYSYNRLNSIEMRTLRPGLSSSRTIRSQCEKFSTFPFGKVLSKNDSLDSKASWEIIPTVRGIEIGAEDIERQLEIAMNRTRQPKNVSRTVRIIIVNRLSFDLTLVSVETESGEWTKGPECEIPSLTVSSMEVCAKQGSVRDLAGVAIYEVKKSGDIGVTDLADDVVGNKIIALRWHNSILATNEYAVQSPKNIIVQRDGGDGDYAEVIFTITVHSRSSGDASLGLDPREAHAASIVSPGPLLFRKQRSESAPEALSEETSTSEATHKLMQLGFEKQIAENALEQSRGDVVAAFENLQK